MSALFRKQGLTPVAVGAEFRAAFLEVARTARERVSQRLVPKELIGRVQSLLADYRAEHGQVK
jgi:hypothetical protein